MKIRIVFALILAVLFQDRASSQITVALGTHYMFHNYNLSDLYLDAGYKHNKFHFGVALTMDKNYLNTRVRDVGVFASREIHILSDGKLYIEPCLMLAYFHSGPRKFPYFGRFAHASLQMGSYINQNLSINISNGYGYGYFEYEQIPNKWAFHSVRFLTLGARYTFDFSAKEK